MYSSSDLQDLRSALNCTGAGQFDVVWFGTVAVDDTFYVPDGSDLAVTGFSSSSTLDGGHRTPFGFFRLHNNSALSLNNLVLNGGYSASYGGAVSAWGEGLAPGPISNTINIVDCTFRDNTAETFGEIWFARDSCVFLSGVFSKCGLCGRTLSPGSSIESLQTSPCQVSVP